MFYNDTVTTTGFVKGEDSLLSSLHKCELFFLFVIVSLEWTKSGFKQRNIKNCHTSFDKFYE